MAVRYVEGHDFRKSVSRARRDMLPRPKVSEAAQKKIEAKKMKAAGLKQRMVRAPDGSRQAVWVYSSSYHAMKFQDHQIAAAEQFSKDYETAFQGLRGMGFEPGVDGGRMAHALHTARVMAQTSIASCRGYIGERSYQIVIAIVINGATVTGMVKECGRDNRSLRADIDWAFNNLAAFYSGSRRVDQTWAAFERFNQERTELIARAEREVG